MNSCMMKNNALNYEYGKIKLLELVGIYAMALVLGVLFRIYGGSLGILLSGMTFYLLPLLWVIIKLKINQIPFRLWTVKVNKSALYDLFFVGILFISFSLAFIIIEAMLFKEGQMEYEKIYWQKLIISALLAPIVEELICRGIILQSFVHKYSVKKAVWLSAILFFIIHLNIFNLLTIFVGVMFAVLMIRHCNLYITMTIHFFWNFILQVKPLLIEMLHSVSNTISICMLILCLSMFVLGVVKSIRQYKFVIKEYCDYI